MKKSVLLVIGLVLALSGCGSGLKTGSLYVTDLPEQTKAADLLVLLLNYDNGFIDSTDEEAEQKWADLIFGTGSIEQGTASINDYFKENSANQFGFQPIKVGDNTTGVYSIHLNKNYSDEIDSESDWPFEEFRYDLASAMEKLATQGLDLTQFQAEGINRSNYDGIVEDYWQKGQDQRERQWYSTAKILAVYPGNNPGNDSQKSNLFPLTTSFDSFAIAAQVNHDSSFGTIAHALTQTLGAIDVSEFGSFGSDLLANTYPSLSGQYDTVHIDPFYKIVYGWVSPTIVTDSSEVKLYPPTSQQYNPVIVRTADNDQYYILENRRSESFDLGLAESISDGLAIWRIDRLGCEAISQPTRQGISLEATMRVPTEFIPRHYTNADDVKDTSQELSNISITYLSANGDGSINASITFQG